MMSVNDESRTFTGDITRERQKITDEVFTPVNIIDDMISRVPDVVNLGVTMFEPAAGDGNIVIRVLELKIQNAGASYENAKRAVSDIYACEYMKDNRDAIVLRVGKLLTDMGLVEDWESCDIRRIAEEQISHCNTLDHEDKSEGRSYPSWLKDALGIKESHSLDFLFD